MIFAILSEHELNVFFINPRTRLAFDAAEFTCSCHVPSIYSRRYCLLKMPKSRNCTIFLNYKKNLCTCLNYFRIHSLSAYPNISLFFLIFSDFTQLIFSLLLVTQHISIISSFNCLTLEVVAILKNNMIFFTVSSKFF